MSPTVPLPSAEPENPLWQQEARRQFPIVIAHPELAYLDSAATSQKPRAVLEAVQTYLTTSNANAGRGTYPWANRTTELVESTRDRIKEFLHDPEPDRSGVHFTSGTTEGLRTVARDWLVPCLADGDEILVPYGDHRANLDPWIEARRLLAERGVQVRVQALPYQTGSGDYDHRALDRAVGPRTRFVAATHVHHVYGGDMNVHRIREAVGPDVAICLDAAQSIGHLPVHVDDPSLDVDFVVFSGHKAMALPGSGAIWARNARGPEFRPDGWQGTPNTTGIVSLKAALDWLDTVGPERVAHWTTLLATRLTDRLGRLGSYEVLGCQASLSADSTLAATQRRRGIVTFRHHDIPSDDLGFILFSHGFMVRADNLCQAGADARDASVRVSLHVYNTVEEIDRLLSVLASLA
ncbi:aminotransferase class V-fold PLP-dependent enzyme [Streptomyces sp. ID03-2B]|uniref:aminotransferase class V-fold PLP-dependent enzyme n=1 Tax=Streptomyces TaxID=1883 RepID=UPI0029BD71F0|nr:aminotransferase class V-fold PLP-dependent enzyme [Streptomyces sp. ID03-2B]MDX3596362.1 aminotransferase class V-fold PLP-dependent enzyme [Streptomyces sp. ID03-2B]